MQFKREQYIELMAFGEVDRQMFSELFGPLVGLDAEWRAQGASEDEIDMVGFDWDYVPYVDCGGTCTAFNTTPPETIEDTHEYLIQRDFLGRTTKLCKGVATLPLPLDFPVKTPGDWDRVKHFYQFDEARIDKHVLRKTRADIGRELEYKMQPLMQQGGTVFGLDHRIPNGTPLDNYRYYVERGRQLLGLPPLIAENKGWGRMAW